jgi:hypothetical protein
MPPLRQRLIAIIFNCRNVATRQKAKHKHTKTKEKRRALADGFPPEAFLTDSKGDFQDFTKRLNTSGK